MFPVSAEITANASEQTPPAKQYVPNPSGRAKFLSASTHLANGSAKQHGHTQRAHTYTEFGGGDGRGNVLVQSNFMATRKRIWYILKQNIKKKSQRQILLITCIIPRFG